MTVASSLAEWAVGLRLDDVPVSARDAALRHLLDGVGNALASRRERAVDPALVVARDLGGHPEARPLGARTAISAPAAALADGALIHGLDFDDTHAGGLVHATAVVLPAAFAVGQQVCATGAQVLEAAMVGYEVVCRVAMATPHGFHARGIHATHAAGTLAAAAVTAKLLSLDAATTTQALGVAGSASGGLLEFLNTGASTKQLHPGTASLNGVLAARLAAAGATGPESVLEGQYGVWAALSAKPADAARVLDGLGSSWEVERITIKPYPACQLMHVTLDAVSAARTTTSFDVADVVEVVADVHPDSASIVCEPAVDKVTPRTSYDAKFSLPWSVAALLIDGQVGVETYAASSIARPDVAELAGRVTTAVTPSDGVAADATGHVVVRLRDGSQVEGRVARSAGGPESPLTDDALTAKFVGNVGGPSKAADELATAVRSIADADDLRHLHDIAARIAEGANA